MGGRNISTHVEVNVKTGRGVGVRKISKNCWEARRPNPGVVTPYWGVTGMMVTARVADSGSGA